MVIIGFTMFTNCKKEVKSEISKTKMEHKKKEVVYQVFTRLFGNTNPTNKPWGTVCSQIKMNFFAQNLREVSANLVKNFDTVFF